VWSEIECFVIIPFKLVKYEAPKRGSGNLRYFGGNNPRMVSSMLCRQETPLPETENGCKLKNGTSVIHGWNGTLEANGCQACECAGGTLYCRE